MDSGELTTTLNDVEQMILAADYLQMDSAMELLYPQLFEIHSFHRRDWTPKRTILMWLRLYNIIREHAIKMKIERNRYHCFVHSTAEQFRRVLHEVDVIRLLNEDRIFELLKSCYLNISEEDVLKTIKVWISYDYDARRPSFQKLLHCIRPLESLRVCGGNVEILSLSFVSIQ